MTADAAGLTAAAAAAPLDGTETGLATSRRLVVKIGSALLVTDDGRVHADWLASLADDVAGLRARGVEVVIVSSGAIALGRQRLGLDGKGRVLRLEEKQAAAAAGQGRLAHAYENALGRHGLVVAQILVTLGDTEERRRHLNARGTIAELLRLGAIPVINENDTVATQEIRFGDNDRLAARVAQMISADTLILLSDVDGVYESDPRHAPTARHLPEIRAVTPAIEAMAGDAPVGYSSGGMRTKLAAAKVALAAGCRMAIARGAVSHPLTALDAGARATWFLPETSPRSARKRWIAGSLSPRGTLTIDAGADRALRAGKSLLPAGVTAVEGDFERGDMVTVRTADGRLVGRGLTAYGLSDATRIRGHRSDEIESLIGYHGRDVMIHRDDLVLG